MRTDGQAVVDCGTFTPGARMRPGLPRQQSTLPTFCGSDPGAADPVLIAVGSGASMNLVRAAAGRTTRRGDLSTVLRLQHLLALVPGKAPSEGFCLGSVADVAFRRSALGTGKAVFSGERWTEESSEVSASGMTVTQQEFVGMGLELRKGVLDSPAALEKALRARLQQPMTQLVANKLAEHVIRLLRLALVYALALAGSHKGGPLAKGALAGSAYGRDAHGWRDIQLRKSPALQPAFNAADQLGICSPVHQKAQVPAVATSTRAGCRSTTSVWTFRRRATSCCSVRQTPLG